MIKILKYIIVIAITLISKNLNSQEYKSILLDYDFNPNVANLIVYKDSVMFTSAGFFTNTGGTVIRTADKNLNEGRDYFFDGFINAFNAFSRIDECLYLYANSRKSFTEDLLVVFTEDQELDTIHQYRSGFEDNLGAHSKSIDNHMYLSWFDDHPDGDRSFGIRKVDTLGNIIWNQNLHFDQPYSQIWDLDSTVDNQLLISNDIILDSPEGGRAFYGQVKKMDQDGNIIWEYTTDYKKASSSGQPLIELDNGNIVLAQKIDGQEEFAGSGLNRTPEQLTFLSSDGSYINRFVFKTLNTEILDALDLVKGRGEYFYAIGSFLPEDLDVNRGFISKFNISGELMWNKTYSHPAYENTGHSHFIENLVELENGDLITLGLARKLPDLPQVWLMKLNSDGCLSETNCGRPLTLSASNPIEEAPSDLFFPNPSKGIFTINEAYYSDISGLKVFNLEGALIYEYQDDIPVQLDLTAYPTGIYTVQISDKDGALSIAKVVKQ